MYAKMIMTAVLSLFVGASAMAASAKYVSGLQGSALKELNLNQADQIFPLVNKYDPATNTTLKMKITTFDLGGSSDVSNLTNVYLSSFSFTEMSQGGALHLIANVTKVLSAVRVAAGVYEIVAEELPVGEDWPGPIDDFRMHTVKYTVEASQLSVDLRQLSGVEEFGSKQFTTPIKITRSVLN